MILIAFYLFCGTYVANIGKKWSISRVEIFPIDYR